MKCLARFSLIVGLLILLTACGPSEAEIEQMVATGVAEALAGTAAALEDSGQADDFEAEEVDTSEQKSEPEVEAPTATPEPETPTPTRWPDSPCKRGPFLCEWISFGTAMRR